MYENRLSHVYPKWVINYFTNGCVKYWNREFLKLFMNEYMVIHFLDSWCTQWCTQNGLNWTYGIMYCLNNIPSIPELFSPVITAGQQVIGTLLLIVVVSYSRMMNLNIIIGSTFGNTPYHKIGFYKFRSDLTWSTY